MKQIGNLAIVCARRKDGMQKSDTEKVAAHYQYQLGLLDGIILGAGN